MKYKLTNDQVLYVLSKVGEDVVIDIPDMPYEVEWKPRTKGELMDQWDDITEETEQSDWNIQARTDDIARVIKQNADQFRWDGPCNASIVIVLDALAKRIRELE